MVTPSFAPETVHRRLLAAARPSCAFNPERDLDAWRAELGARLRNAVGLLPERVDLDVRVEWTKSGTSYNETRFVFRAEPGADVPCHLLVPDQAFGPVPVIVCLQGHSPGMHVSLDATAPGDRDFALQAIARGYAALVIEQRCFGERVDARPEEDRVTRKGGCHHASHTASLLGRTMVGERVWDVSRALDALAHFPEVDAGRVACMGNSGGGTISWYATCLDDRISAVMPSCSVCTYRDSIAAVNHCCDNYLPGALRHFDMPDLAGLIAPRPLVVVTGRDDPLFPVAAVREAFTTIEAVYAAVGAADRCELVVGDGGHRFYAAASWPVFDRLTGWPAG